MKTQITISGGLNGNSRIMTKLSNFTDYKRTNYGAYTAYYQTKKQAIADIRAAYNELCDDEPHRKNKRAGGIVTNKSRTILHYDASTAIVNSLNS
jgi:hypothetical protein